MTLPAKVARYLSSRDNTVASAAISGRNRIVDINVDATDATASGWKCP
ncbi:hypothetical protein [Methanosarcina sp.]|nr:hypothetical protein [Methanosarcina sp.]MDY9926064.1 hypothetical protein [Methanosarcina sp.]